MVYYAVYYSTKDSGRVKNYAGEDKVDYICKALNEIGEDVIILSNAKTTKKQFAKQEEMSLFDRTKLICFSSLPRVNTLVHALNVLWGYIQLILYVFWNVKDSDTILVYHSLGYRGIWGCLRKIKKFKYILEVEELYQSFEASASSYKKHEKSVFKYPDAFIFSNSILAEEINKSQKPSIVINGIYSGGEKKKEGVDGRRRVVYAGSFEKQKGVDYVIRAAKYLPREYEVHIIGFGSAKDIERIRAQIDKVAGNGAMITYDGAFKGSEYIDFLQSCDVGVCIQDENDEFNKYEYPSKIFSYLSNGLQVVVNDLVQLRKSDVYPFLHVSHSKEPRDVAMAIERSFDKQLEAKDILCKLDAKFKHQVQDLMRR